ncbi:NADH-quinone oxidoreductase subunit J [Lysobacter sp. HDW10]|jgi:NADH-quinone oxidoreductase subunit J|uniref:NADH-quinone oxidoreductase subunit J n=1 Tax=Lysobacter sp. HDW10 TaxID=2714936 RepID=UPI0014083D95|nr:NADH-quinone oxidoreductase subunit J [Lysobacter sp. HDW10]QIK81618.1 NADH-quinone oxidoreductase subunit J [Lysobacter sp. HDW10]
MDFTLIAFYAFAVLAAAAALGVISVRNPVVAALLLVLTFFSVACTWIIAGAEFLGVALIVVYVGAVMVLFLFVVMMLDLNVAPLREGFVKFLPVGLAVALIMLAEMLTLIGVRSNLVPFKEVATDMPNAVWLARTLFTDFLLPFEVAAVILTMAVVAAVMLTLRRRPGIKHQVPSDQVRVKAEDRVRMIKMQASEKRVISEDASTEEGAP